MKRQSGAVLALCLVFLALLAVMAISGMESILLHERMEANRRLSRVGYEATEAALREVEEELLHECPDVGAGFSRDLPSASADWRQVIETSPAWWELNGVSAEISVPNLEPPRYFLESWRESAIPPGEPDPVYYRITARGANGRGIGSSILQALGVVVCNGADAMAQTRLSWRQLL